MSHDIFISYSHEDKAAADAACAVLESEGLRCWIAPRDIVPGTEWTESIIDAIGRSRALVLLFSRQADASPQVRREVERAIHHAIPIVPVRIEDVMPGKAMEYLISTPHWMDAISPPLEAHYRQLAQSLKTLIGQKPPAVVGDTREVSAYSPAAHSAQPVGGKNLGRKIAVAAIIILCIGAGAIGAWVFSHHPPPPPTNSGPTPVAAAPAVPAAAPAPSPSPAATNSRTLVGGVWHDSVTVDGAKYFVEGQFQADGTMFGRVLDVGGNVISQGPGKWTLGQTGHYTYVGGYYEEGQIDWIDEDHFLYTILKTTNPVTAAGQQYLNSRTHD
jgi:hypothetical protein